MPPSNDQSTTDRAELSRREAFRKLGAGGVAAAALASLPSGNAEGSAALIQLAAAPAPPACHPLFCFHDKYRLDPAVKEEYRRLDDELRAQLTHEQWVLHNGVVTLATDAWVEEQDRFVDELCRHFPGLAPAIRAVAWHVIEERRDEDVGVCCSSAETSEGRAPA
jgi:hypothetical protein